MSDSDVGSRTSSRNARRRTVPVFDWVAPGRRGNEEKNPTAHDDFYFSLRLRSLGPRGENRRTCERTLLRY